MNGVKKKVSTLVTIMGMALILVLPRIGYAQSVEDTPSALAMTGDLLFVRPVLIGVTVLGSVGYVLSLPFSLAGGNASEVGSVLVAGPAKAAFVRCLGCTRVGYKRPVKEFDQ